MDNSCSDLEFFDLSNATDEEIKEIRDILNNTVSNGCVELPWEVSPISHIENAFPKTEAGVSEAPVASPVTTVANSLGTVVGQALLYAPPQIPPPTLSAAQATQLPLQSSDVIPSVETFMPQIPPISAASAIGAHYPAPYLVPRTLPYLRAYPHHVGVPLFTCTLPNSGELTHVPSPYTPFLPLAAPVSAVPQAHLEKPVEHKEDHEIRAKVKGTSDRQFNRRNKKKHMSSGSYYSPPDFGQGSDTYNDPVLADDPSLASGSIGSNRLAAMPCVPVPVPQSTFPVTSGALPMPSYPPGLHPLSYSQISGPQAPTPPVYYVPVFNHSHYRGYIAPASAPMMLPVGNVNVPTASIHPTSESECSVTNEGAEDMKSSESLAASTESIEKTSESSVPIESDCEVSPVPKLNSKTENTNAKEIELSNKVVNDEVPDSCSQESSDTLTELSVHRNSNVPVSNEEHVEKIINKTYSDSSRCWADLFKKQCTEMNGLDRQNDVTDKSSLEETNNKDITNGKLCNVPNNDSVL